MRSHVSFAISSRLSDQMISSLDSLTSWLSHSLAICSVVSPSYLVTESDSSCYFHYSLDDTWQRDSIPLYSWQEDKSSASDTKEWANENMFPTLTFFSLSILPSFSFSCFLTHLLQHFLSPCKWQWTEREGWRRDKRRRDSHRKKREETGFLFLFFPPFESTSFHPSGVPRETGSLWLNWCGRTKERD